RPGQAAPFLRTSVRRQTKAFARRCAALASHFSLLVQRKVTKRKHTPDANRPAAPAGALRFSAGWGRPTTRFAQTRGPPFSHPACDARFALRGGEINGDSKQRQKPGKCRNNGRNEGRDAAPR